MDLPHLTAEDYKVLHRLRQNNKLAFFSNMTRFFVGQMYKYIDDARIWRCSIMGEPRIGKSEVGSTFYALWVKYLNKKINGGYFNDLDIVRNGDVKLQPVQFTPKYVMANQSDYIYSLREVCRDDNLIFGQLWQIDETREKIGGVGSFSEQMEQKNLSNIIAKFMQSEIWITPMKMLEERNVPFGLYVYKKDIKERVNWCLLYKIERGTYLGTQFNFLGWVKVPLHGDEVFRKLYNEKKNDWIKKEIEGTEDKRMVERKKAAKILSGDEEFSMFTPSGKRFVLNKLQQYNILEDYIIDEKIQNWNDMERWIIIEDARRLAMKQQRELESHNLTKEFKEVKDNGED